MLFLFCCLLTNAVITGLVLIPQYLRHSALQRLSWFWNDRSDLSITARLNLPPFGIGMNRSVRQQMMERSRSGLPFQAFRYSSDFWDGEQQVVYMLLLYPMSPFHLFRKSVSIPGIQDLIMDA